MKTLVVILIIALAGNSSGFGRTSALPETNQSATGKSANAKAHVELRGVGPRSRVKVRLRTHSEVTGYISAIDDATFQVTDRKNGQVTTMTYDEVERVSGPGLPKVAKIGIWAGAVAGAFMLTVVLIVASWHGN
jgi:hypothetical protein